MFYESGLFVDFFVHRGMDNSQDRVVARYQPGAIEELDVEKFLRGKKAGPESYAAADRLSPKAFRITKRLGSRAMMD